MDQYRVWDYDLANMMDIQKIVLITFFWVVYLGSNLIWYYSNIDMKAYLYWIYLTFNYGFIL